MSLKEGSVFPSHDSRVVLSWSAYIDFFDKPDEQRRMCEAEWGGIPPAVALHQGVATPLWDLDGVGRIDMPKGCIFELLDGSTTQAVRFRYRRQDAAHLARIFRSVAELLEREERERGQ